MAVTFAGVAALAAGEVTVAVVAAAAVEVGLTMTVVGAVTGSKDLMKVGGVLSLAGGIGGLAAGALDGAAGAMAGEAGSLATEAAGAGMAAGETGAMDMMGSLGTGMEAGSTAGIGASSGIGATSMGSEMTGALDQGIGGSGILGQEMASNAPQTQFLSTLNENGAAQTAQQLNQAANPGSQLPTTAAERLSGQTPYSKAPVNQTGNMGPNAPDPFAVDGANISDNALRGGMDPTWGSRLSSLGDWIENHKALATMGGNLIGGVFQGIQKQHEADRLYDLNRQRLGILQQEQDLNNQKFYNMSHTSLAPTVRSTGILASNRSPA